MADFELGQTFLDKKSTNYSGTKGKYYIALSNADDDDDPIICFVMNSEHRMDKYSFGCNKQAEKFIINKGTFSFINHPTSIMLVSPVMYKLSEMYESTIVLFEIAEENLCRQIKNCINWNSVPIKFQKIIKGSFSK